MWKLVYSIHQIVLACVTAQPCICCRHIHRKSLQQLDSMLFCTYARLCTCIRGGLVTVCANGITGRKTAMDREASMLMSDDLGEHQG